MIKDKYILKFKSIDKINEFEAYEFEVYDTVDNATVCCVSDGVIKFENSVRCEDLILLHDFIYEFSSILIFVGGMTA